MDPKELTLKALNGSYFILNSIVAVKEVEEKLVIRLVPPSDEVCDDLAEEITETLTELYGEDPVFTAIGKMFYGSDGKKNLILIIQNKTGGKERLVSKGRNV